jgi:uncharacterized protein YceH (UPF0502 family)
VELSDFAVAADEAESPSKRGALEARVEALESEVAALRRELEAVQARAM